MQSTPSTSRASAKALLAVLGVALAASVPAVAKQSDRSQPTNVTSTSFDGTQQQANSTQPGKVIWTGNVVLTQGTLKITGNKATGFLDADNQITRVIVDGTPATVQQLDDQDLLMRGHASNIDYKPDDPANSSDGIAILTGKAHVDKQTDTADKSKLNQSDGDKITYNTTNSTMTGESNGPEPVHMTFQPKAQPAGAAPATPPAAKPPAATPPQPKKP